MSACILKVFLRIYRLQFFIVYIKTSVTPMAIFSGKTHVRVEHPWLNLSQEALSWAFVPILHFALSDVGLEETAAVLR